MQTRYKALLATCSCGSKLVRVHRTLAQKLIYMAVFRCPACDRASERRRRFMFYFASETLCPLCGTRRISRLSTRDRIDRLHHNLFSLVHPLLKVQLYHCRYCRIQFYDRPHRNCPPESPPTPPAAFQSGGVPQPRG